MTAGRTVAYRVTTALLVSELAMGGIWDLLRLPMVRSEIERLGYPSYVLIILGAWKILGALALSIPRFPILKEWAYAGVVFDVTGALASHLAASYINPGQLVFLIAMLGITAVSWALRPASRRLGRFHGSSSIQ